MKFKIVVFTISATILSLCISNFTAQSQTLEEIETLTKKGKLGKKEKTEPADFKQAEKVAKAEKKKKEKEAKEALAKAEKEKAEKEALAKAEKAKAEKEALAKAEKEKAEKEALAEAEKAKAEKEKAEKETIAKAEKEKKEKEALAKAEKTKAEKEKAEKETLAKAEKEKKEKEALAKAEKTKAEKEKAKKETIAQAEKAKKEKEVVAKTKKEKAEKSKTFEAGTSELTWKQHKKLAKAMFKEKNYEGAATEFKNAYAKNPKPDMAWAAAEAFYLVRDYKSAMPLYNDLYDDSKYPLAKFKYALTQKMGGNYTLAIKSFNEFLDGEYKDDIAKFKKFAKREKLGCEEAMEEALADQEHEVEQIAKGANSIYNESAPTFYKDGELVYSTSITGKVTGADNVQLHKSKGSNGNWGKATLLTGDVNKEEQSISNPTFSADGKTMYYTLCKPVDCCNEQCAIYASSLKNGAWSKGVKLNEKINALESSSSHPHINVSEDGKEILYFTSNRIGSKGGMDIYWSVKDAKGNFGRPKNMGSKINTSRDDISPFYDSKEGILYFSSNGHINYGGFDVFKTANVNDEWSDIENVGMPINSSFDDYHFEMDRKGKQAIFTSNRTQSFDLSHNACCDDLYEVSFGRGNVIIQVDLYTNSEKEGREREDRGMVRLFDAKADSMVEDYTIYDGGRAYFELKSEEKFYVTSTKKGFELGKEQFSINDTEADTLYVSLVMDEIEQPKLLGKVIGTVFFEFNKFQLTEDAPLTMDKVVKLMKNNKNLKVEIGGHTDDVGTSKYNEELSIKRAEAVNKAVTVNGEIDDSRTKTVGYGETKPLEDNKNADGSDNAQGREKNRRVEFIVIEE